MLLKDSNQPNSTVHYSDELHLPQGSYFILALVIKPIIVLAAIAIGQQIWPAGQSLVANWNFWLALLTYLLIDDLMQYTYHRAAHEYPFL